MKKQLSLTFQITVTLFLIFGFSFTHFGQNIKPVGEPVDFANANEIDPALSKDGNLLAFISNRSGQYKIYLCTKKGTGWSIPEEIASINKFNNGKGNIRYPSFNYDGSTLYFCADFYNDSSNVDIFYSIREANGWSAPISIGAPINTTGYDGQPSISADNKTLYFSRNSSSQEYNNYDCKKIYFSAKGQDGNWEKPAALPIPINVDCEQCPRIGIDNKTLYFSSDPWHMCELFLPLVFQRL